MTTTTLLVRSRIAPSELSSRRPVWRTLARSSSAPCSRKGMSPAQMRSSQDWLWYADGASRLIGGRPLYDPLVLAGPYNSFDVNHLYIFTSVPPYVASIAAAILALLDTASQPIWTVGTLGAAAASIWLTFP